MKRVAGRGPQTLPRGVDTLGMWKPRKNASNSTAAVDEGCVSCLPAAEQCGTHTCGPGVTAPRGAVAPIDPRRQGKGKGIVLVRFFIFFLSFHVA